VLTPEQFWGLTVSELWWTIEAVRPERTFGRMSEAEVEQIYAETYGDG
jgi:hypothetical protein